MGLFSSKSRSTTNLTDNSKNVEAAIGDLSSDNRIVTGDYYEQGLVGENLQSILDSHNMTFERALDSQNLTFERAVTAVQMTAETAINETGEAYAESKSELRNFIDAVRPIALYAAIVASFYFIFRRG